MQDVKDSLKVLREEGKGASRLKDMNLVQSLVHWKASCKKADSIATQVTLKNGIKKL